MFQKCENSRVWLSGRASASQADAVSPFLSKSTHKLGDIGSGFTYFLQSHFSNFLETFRSFIRIMFFGWKEGNYGSHTAMAGTEALHRNNQRMVKIYQAL